MPSSDLVVNYQWWSHTSQPWSTFRLTSSAWSSFLTVETAICRSGRATWWWWWWRSPACSAKMIQSFPTRVACSVVCFFIVCVLGIRVSCAKITELMIEIKCHLGAVSGGPQKPCIRWEPHAPEKRAIFAKVLYGIKSSDECKGGLNYRDGCAPAMRPFVKLHLTLVISEGSCAS